MFKKILIANRGEIACRVIKTASRLGVRTVAVYSEADAGAMHVAMADEAFLIGPPPAAQSYLQADMILDVAKRAGAEAVHPGYGFLSENAGFAKACLDANITFIGPPVDAIKAMGSKAAAKTIMEAAGVPLLPGYHGDAPDAKTLARAASDIGYPVLLKAVAGGGGKGMRRVDSEAEFEEALKAAQREAVAGFGNDIMLVEKCLENPRHVEVQVFCDSFGEGVYLAERDCSVQRRHQKIIEEAPAPGLSDDVRRAMGESAVRAAKAINYEGAGTVEFLYDDSGAFYFMEMNTRLQVEHPVTEMISGEDLVEWQLRVASGEALPKSQQELQFRGHAFEARIYAEDPDNDFLPASGQLTSLATPEESRHVRVDTGVRQGDTVSVYYDPMIAKLISWDENRSRALARLTRALSEYRVAGVTTNLRFLYNLSTAEDFAQAKLGTGFIETHREELFRSRKEDLARMLPLASLYLLLRMEQKAAERAVAGDRYSPWNSASGWRLNKPWLHKGQIEVDGVAYDVPVEEIAVAGERLFRIQALGVTVLAKGSLRGEELSADIDGHRSRVSVIEDGDGFNLFTDSGVSRFARVLPDFGEVAEQGSGGFEAPMNGTVISVNVSAGATVEKGQTLVVMEAMKMEHAIKAPADGQVVELFCKEGELVDGGSELLSFEIAS